MRRVFADTFYWIALLNPRDQAHDLAASVSEGLGAVRIVTTEEVLTELLNFFGSRGPHFRRAAVGLVERMRSDPMIDVVAQTHAGFLAGCVLYQARPDKGYSLTDCISMNVMRRDGLIEVLTNDEHFAQEGFSCLLRD
jgi:predicted nucleic acid-binding protein